MSDLIRLADFLGRLRALPSTASDQLDLLIQEARETGGAYLCDGEDGHPMFTLDLHGIRVTSLNEAALITGWIAAAQAVLADARARDAHDMAWARSILSGTDDAAPDGDLAHACQLILRCSLIHEERHRARELLASLQAAA